MKALVDTIPLRAQVRWQFQILVDPLRLNKQQPLLHNANKNILSFTFIQTNWITLFNFTDYNLQPEKKNRCVCGWTSAKTFESVRVKRFNLCQHLTSYEFNNKLQYKPGP